MITYFDDKRSKYRSYGWNIIIIFGYYLIIRGFSAILFDYFPEWWEILLYVPVVYPILYFLYLGPLKKTNEAQGIAQSIDYNNALLHKPKQKPEQFLLPLRDVYEVELDFENDNDLTDKFSSTLFLTYKSLTITFLMQQEIDRSNLSYKNRRKAGKTLLKLEKYRDKLNKKKEDGEAPPSEEETKKKLKEAKTELDDLVKESEDLGIFVNKSEWNMFSTKKKDKDTGEFEDVNLKEFKKEIQAIKGKEEKPRRFYFAKLDYAVSFEDGESFEWIFLILPDYYNKVLKTHKGDGNYDGWSIKIREVFCYYLYLCKVGKSLPVLMLKYSENMADEDAEHIKNIKAKAFSYFLLKVMLVWIADLEIRPENLQIDNDFYKTENARLKYTLSDKIQEIANNDIIYSKFLENIAVSESKEKAEKSKKRFQLVLVGFIASIIIFCIIIALILNLR